MEPKIVSIALEEISSPEGVSWFEVYAVLEDGSISHLYDEILPDLDSAIKILRRFVNDLLRI